MRYIFVRLEIRVVEREFFSDCLHPVSSPVSKEEFADECARTFYGGSHDPADGGYYFDGGEVHVSVHRVDEVTEADAAVLSRYI